MKLPFSEFLANLENDTHWKRALGPTSHFRHHIYYYCKTSLILEEGNGTPLQYSCLENPMDRGAWWAAVHGIAKSRTRLGDFTFTFHFHALEKEMAAHSSVLAWRIPGTAEPGGLPSMRSHRVGHNWSDLAAAAAALFYLVFLSKGFSHQNMFFFLEYSLCTF